MRFATKIFLAVFLPSIGFTLSISAMFYTSLSSATRDQFVSHYQSVTRQVAATLTQLETTTDVLMASSVRVLAERVQREDLLSTEELLRLRNELGVSHLYILNSAGVFLRATGDDPAHLPNAFSFCSKYQHMFEQGIPFQPTGLMPGIPTLVPHKFLFLPSHDRRYLLEVGVRADFIGQTLRQTLAADSDLLSLALYAPNGANLGEFTADGHSSYERSLGPSANFAVNTTRRADRLYITAQVVASHADCCSCRQRGLIGAGDYHYYLRTQVSTQALDATLRRLSWTTALLVGLGLLLSMLASRWLSRWLVFRIHLMNDQANAIMRTGDLGRRLNLHDTDEVGQLSAKFDEMLATLQNKQLALIQLEKSKAAIETTAQVAHDIRSPLAALDTLLYLIPDLPEEPRVLLRTAVNRIHMISNNLLEQTRRLRASDPGETASGSAPVTSELLWSLLETVLSEKREQYRSRIAVHIELVEPAHAYGPFVNVNTPLFQRTLSNLIDNSVEAIDLAGRVEIAVTTVNERVQIAVRDTGRGIPAEVLPTLMQKGRTYGKSGGSGLGLYAAHQALRSWHGDIQITSELERGTIVTLTLPQTQPPAWFVHELRLQTNATVIIADDDPSIHEVWRTRFGKWPQLKLLHFSSTHELRKLCANEDVRRNQLLCLIDHEFRNSNESGLDCIESLGLGQFSILVTNRADDLTVRDRCTQLQIGLIPKRAAPLVPVRIG